MQDIDDLIAELNRVRKKYDGQTNREIEETLLEKGKEVMSIVTKALYLKFGGQVPVISGGFSVEYYTAGKHTTEDIDLIINESISNPELHKLFETLGFEKKGTVLGPWMILEYLLKK